MKQACNNFYDNFQHSKKFSRGVSSHGLNYFVLMEYCENGSLSDRIHKSETVIRQEDFYDWSVQISSGMTYLHLKKIIHRNLKPAK